MMWCLVCEYFVFSTDLRRLETSFSVFAFLLSSCNQIKNLRLKKLDVAMSDLCYFLKN